MPGLVLRNSTAHDASVKHAVITGGTGGLGTAIAAAFASSDWDIAAIGSSDLDLADRPSIAHWFHDRPVDLLICAAGITLDAPLPRLDEKSWDRTVEINFNGAAACAKAAANEMIHRKAGGHIVFISSYSAIHPPIGQIAYATAKAALLGLTTDLARLYGSEGIRVNAILPGFLETAMTAKLSVKRTWEVLREHHLGNFNTTTAAAGFIRHLHDHMPHTSGQIFQLDSRT